METETERSLKVNKRKETTLSINFDEESIIKFGIKNFVQSILHVQESVTGCHFQGQKL